MPFLLLRFLFMAAVAYIGFRLIKQILGGLFSDTKECPRCDGKGWWQNTRNRDKCEWCEGSGRLPKDMPV